MAWVILAAVSFLLPTIVGGVLLPAGILDALNDMSRWLISLVLIVVTLFGFLQKKLDDLLKDAEGTEGWRILSNRLAVANKLSVKLRHVIVTSLLMGVVLFFFPQITPVVKSWSVGIDISNGAAHSLVTVFPDVISAIPVGVVCYTMFVVLSWLRWSRIVDNIHRDLRVRKRQLEERRVSLERFSDSSKVESNGKPPSILNLH
ncbi:MAG: hypothetical protein M0Q49_02165 [Porticoccaceae bacterium]|nr:hypothetical protein [Porticoccaceae bacterium]